MGILENIREKLTGEHGIDISMVDLPLSDDAANTLNELISRGVFNDKSDFMQFIAHAYTANNLGAAMSGGQEPPESTIMDIIKRTGLGKGFSEGYMKKMLVPLLLTGFMAIYRHVSKRKAPAKGMKRPSFAAEPSISLREIDLPLSGDAANMLNRMISRGMFKDKADFVNFLVNAYTANNLGAAMSGGREPPESTIMDIINKAGIGKGQSDRDIKKIIVPLLITGFLAIYRHMSKRQPAVKPA